MDILFINPGSSEEVYQGLSTDYAGIGTPYWALLLSQSCRSQGYKVGILDILAEGISRKDAVERIKTLNPRLISVCVYGENGWECMKYIVKDNGDLALFPKKAEDVLLLKKIF